MNDMRTSVRELRRVKMVIIIILIIIICDVLLPNNFNIQLLYGLMKETTTIINKIIKTIIIIIIIKIKTITETIVTMIVINGKYLNSVTVHPIR